MTLSILLPLFGAQAAGESRSFDFRYLGSDIFPAEGLLEAGVERRGLTAEGKGENLLLESTGRGQLTVPISVEVGAEYLFRINIRSKDQVVCRIGGLSMSYNDLGEWQTVTGLYRNNDSESVSLNLTLAPLEGRQEAKAEIGSVSMVRVERPTTVKRREISGETALIRSGSAKAAIVIPEGAESYGKLAEKIVAAVQEKSGVTLPVLTDLEVTEAEFPALKSSYRDTHLILLGRLGNNRAFWTAYNRFLTAVDGYYPGGDGYAVHTAANLFYRGINHLIIGGTSDLGVSRGVDKFLEKIAALPEGKDLSLPWLLEIDLQGDCLAFFKADDAQWKEVPESVTLPKPEPGYGNVIRWYQNAMGYYWTGWDAYKERADKQLNQVLSESAITHHYIVEFFVRTFEMLHASGVLSPEQVRATDSLITKNFLDFLTVSDLSWMTTFAPPYGQVNLVNRHQVAPWIGDLKMAQLLTNVMLPEGGMKDLVEFRRQEKERAFNDFVTHRSGPSLPGGVTPSACEEIIATFFRYALENDLYKEFFASGNARKALTLERINALTGQYILPSGNRDSRLLLGIMSCLTGDPEMKWLWSNLPESIHVRGHFQGRYLGQVRRYTPDASMPEAVPTQGLGVQIAPNPVANAPLRSGARDYYFLAYRGNFGKDDDYVAFNGVNYTAPSGVMHAMISNGVSWFSATSEGAGRFGKNSATAVRTDGGGGKTGGKGDELSRCLWNAETPVGTAIRMRQTLSQEVIWTRDFVVLGKGLFVFRDEFKAFKPGNFAINVNWHPIGQGNLKGNRASYIVRDGKMEMIFLGNAFAPLMSAPGESHLRNQALTHLEAGESAVSYTVIQTAKSHAQPFVAATEHQHGLTLRDAGKEIHLGWKPGEWSGFTSDADLVIQTEDQAAFYQVKTLEERGHLWADLSKPDTLTLSKGGVWIGLPDSPDAGKSSALFASLQSAWKSFPAIGAKPKSEEHLVTIRDRAAKPVWEYDGFLRPALVRGYRTGGDGVVDFGKPIRLTEIRAKWVPPIWSPTALPEKLLVATEKEQWSEPGGKRQWRPGIRTANYGEAHPVAETDETLILDGVSARYVKNSDGAALSFFTSDELEARHPIRLESGDFLGRGTPQVLVVSDVFPQFPRPVRDDDLSVALLDENGGQIFKHDLVGPVQSIRLLDRQGRGQKELFVLYANGTLEVYNLSGELEASADLYQMHAEFHRTHAQGHTRAPAGGYVLPFSIGTWRPDANGRRKLLIGRYGGFTSLGPDLSFEGLLNVSGYATPGMLERGVDFGSGIEEQVVAERLRLWHLGGSDQPKVRDANGAQYWPQVYELLKTIPEDESSKVPLGGMPIRRYELLANVSEQPRYLLLARGTTLSIYDGKTRSIHYSWSAPAPISGVAITEQAPGRLKLAIATADSLLWEMRWEQGLEQPPVSDARIFPDTVNALQETPEGGLLISAAQGLYLQRSEGDFVRLASGAFQSAAPMGRGIVAATGRGEVLYLNPKDTLIKASTAASWSFPRLFEPLFPHLSAERLRKSGSKIHRNCLRLHPASFNQRIPNP